MHLINKFGHGEIYSLEQIISDEVTLKGLATIYCKSTACMSVTSDMQSWASKHLGKRCTFVSNNSPSNNNIIIVLGCQVTDLAILNDIKTIESLHNENPEAKVFMGGCLAYRFDIELPNYVNRLGATREVYEPISNNGKSAVNWADPFWVKSSDYAKHTGEFDTGRLFREMYPLKIGAGCHGKCKYCTIRDTRGNSYETDAYLQVSEFLQNDNVVLISDSPSAEQLNDWAELAIRYNKPISIRNVEPRVLEKSLPSLVDASARGLIKVFHCPIQSNDEELLSIMGRSWVYTMSALEHLKILRKLGTKIATNIIIDYEHDGKVYGEITDIYREWLNKNFDYWSWNPYFDGHWDRKKAEERWKKYIDM